MPRAIRLEQLHIPEPCHADWSTMAGDERSRFCASCHKQVHDLSAMSRGEAEALVNAHAGKLCVQFTLDSGGRVMTQDGPRRFQFVRRFAPVLSMAVAFALSIVGCRRGEDVKLAGTPRPGEVRVYTLGIVALNTTQPTTIPTQVRGERAALPPASQPETIPAD